MAYPSNIIRQIITLNRDEVQLVDAYFKPQLITKGERLLDYGQVCRFVGLVETGCCRYYMLQDDAELTYAFSNEGDFVSNYESVLTQSPSTKVIEALEDCKIWLLPLERLQKIYLEIRQGERFGRIAIEQQFVKLLEQITSLYTESPTQRYLTFLNNYPELIQRIPQYIIASFVGVQPQSLSRIRKKLADRDRS